MHLLWLLYTGPLPEDYLATCTRLSLIATGSRILTIMFALTMFESPARNMHVGQLS